MLTEMRSAVIEAFTEMTTLPPLNHIVQYGREKASARFTLKFDGGLSLHVENSDVLFSRTQMTKLIAVNCHEAVNPGKQERWTMVIVGILKNASLIEEDPDEKLASSVDDWVSQYADANASTDRDGAARRRSPFTDPRTKQLHINLDHFARWVRTTLMAQVSTIELRLALIDLGWERTAVQYDAGSHSAGRKRTKTRYWREPTIGGHMEPEPLIHGESSQLALERPRALAPQPDDFSHDQVQRGISAEPPRADDLAQSGSA